jgi:hypothetical protein
MKIFLFIILIFLSISANSQSLTFFDLDASNFPNVKGKFLSYDIIGNQLRHEKKELTIQENGFDRTIVSVNCPVPPIPKSLSSVLVMDVSLSMIHPTGLSTNLELAQAAAISWVNALPIGNNECAITSFSEYNYINQDFTNDKSKLLKAINQLKPIGGTDYDMALLNPMGGGLKVSKYGKYQRVIIFLTDGEPNREPKTSDIILEAQNQNCIVYCVTLGIKAPKLLHEIATKTGGAVFENVTTIQQAEGVYQQILQMAKGVSPCSIEWISNNNCVEDSVSAALMINASKVKNISKYRNNKLNIEEIQITPSTVRFRGNDIGESVSQTVSVKSVRGLININDIISSDPQYTITPKSFSLKQGDSINLNISFTAKDDLYSFTEFTFVGNICSSVFYANGLSKSGRPDQNTLRLTHPNGGELFLVGSDTIITWTGISKNDKVRIEYSIDSGRTWIYVDTARGLSYKWSKIRRPTSNKCLVNVVQIESEDEGNSFEVLLDEETYNIPNYEFTETNEEVLIAANDISTWDTLRHSITHWDIKQNKLNKISKNYGQINRLSFSPKNDLYAKLLNSYHVDIVEKISDTVIDSVDPKFDRGVDISFNSNGNLLSVIGFNVDSTNVVKGNTIVIFTLSRSNKLNDFRSIDVNYPRKDNALRGVKFSPLDSNILATVSSDNAIDVWNLDWANKYCELKPQFVDSLDRFNTVLNYAFSPKSRTIIASYNDGLLRFYDLLKCKEISSTLNPGFVRYFSLSNDGRLIATFNRSLDNKIKIWDLLDGTELHSIDLPSKFFGDVKFTKDDRYLAVMYKTNGRLNGKSKNVLRFYSLDKIGLQSDYSDSLFSIVEPAVSADDVNMGDVILSKSKDSIVDKYVRNIGLWPLDVEKIYFRGIDSSSFRLISGIPKYNINVGKNKSAEFSFTPKRLGVHNAEIVIITQSDTLVKRITGNGIQQDISIQSRIVDFGLVEVNQKKDSINVATIKNLGTVPITIDSTKHSLPNNIDFTTLSGGGTFNLLPGQEKKIDLRFSPSSIGRTLGTLEFYYRGLGSPAIVQLFGEGIKKSPSILTSIRSMKNLLCEESDTFDVAITNNGEAILDIRNIIVSGINSSEFRYIGNKNVSILPDSIYYASVIFNPMSSGNKSAELVIYSNADQDSIVILQLNTIKNESSLSLIKEINVGILCPVEEKRFDVNILNTGTINTPITIVSDSTIETNSLRDSLFVGQQKNVSFTFKGLQNTGPFTRQIAISDTCGNIYPVTLKGTVISPIIESGDLSISSIIGRSSESFIKLNNLSDVDIVVNSISGISKPFSLQTPKVPFTLPGKSVQEIKISYLPLDTVLSTQTLFVTGDPCLLKDTVLITGMPTSARAVIMVGNYSGYPGDVINIPIVLIDSQNINQSGLTSISFDVAFNPSVLSPRGHTIRFINDTLAMISIIDEPVITNGNGEIISLTCDIGLGNSEQSQLSLLNVVENTKVIPLTIKNGKFILLGICHEGGTRLVSTSNITSLIGINPNPINGMINISINMLENGKHTIRILDSRGFLVKETVHDLQQGQLNLRYDSIEFMSGMYFIQIQTPTQFVIERFVIQK